MICTDRSPNPLGPRRVRARLQWDRVMAVVLLASLAPVSGVHAALPMVVTSVAERIAAVEQLAAKPSRYAVGLPPSSEEIDLASGGLEVFSAAAVSIGLRLRAEGWPEDIPLTWRATRHDEAHQIMVTGPQVWLPDLRGDSAVLEWPTDQLPDDAHLSIEQVVHGYRGLDQPSARGLGNAGSCNIDVACPQGNDWDDAIRATTRVTFDDSSTTRSVCSAALLNNTADDDRPLLITARHCGIVSSNANSVITLFNYQRSVCGGSNDGVELQRISGATWITESPPADTTLLQLSSIIPAEFNAHLGGWLATTTAPQFGVAAHHPIADQKKISLFTQPAQVRNGVNFSDGSGGSGFTADTWRVIWSLGITQPGSSGSGLWNPSQQVVGTLSGGSSACEAGLPNGLPDFFGRLDVAWDDSPALRLALDPVGGGTQRNGCGRDNLGAPCSIIVTRTPQTEPSVTPTPSPTSTATPTPIATPIATPTPTPESGTEVNGSGGGGGLGLMSMLMLVGALSCRRLRRHVSTSHRIA